MSGFEVEHMALDHTGIPLDFDFPTLLAYEGGLIPVLRKKQPHIIAGAAVGTRALNGKLDHPAGAVLKTLYGQVYCVLSAHGLKYPLIGGSFHRSWSLWRFFCHASSSLIMVSCIRWGV